MTAIQQEERFRLTPEGERALAPSCLKCPHMRTCVIFRTMGRFLASEFPPLQDGTQTAPFKPEEIAKLCKYYVSPIAQEITP